MNKLKRCQILLLLVSGVLSTKSMDVAKQSHTTSRKSLLKDIANATAARKAKLEKPVAAEETRAVVTQNLTAEPIEVLAPLVLAERVLLCTQKMQETMVALQPLLSGQEQLKAQQLSNVAMLLALGKRKEPLESEMKNLITQQANCTKEETKIIHKKQAALRVHQAIVEFAMHEPDLEKISREQLTPILFDMLDTQKKELAAAAKNLKTLWTEKNNELKPLLAEEKKVAEAKEKRTQALLALEQNITEHTNTKAVLESERAKYLKTLEQLLETAENDKRTIEDEISALKPTIAEEKDTTVKLQLRKDLAQQERTLKTCRDSITELTQALNKAQGKTGLFGGWFTSK